MLPDFSKNSSKNLCLNEVINEQKLVKFSKITQCMNGIRTKCPHLCSILQTPDIIPVTFLQTLSCFLQTRMYVTVGHRQNSFLSAGTEETPQRPFTFPQQNSADVLDQYLKRKSLFVTSFVFYLPKNYLKISLPYILFFDFTTVSFKPDSVTSYCAYYVHERCARL